MVRHPSEVLLDGNRTVEIRVHRTVRDAEPGSTELPVNAIVTHR